VRVLQFLAAFGVSLCVTAAILPAVIRWAHYKGALDRPGGRRVHFGAIPRVGGIGIFLGFIAGTGAAILMTGKATTVSEPDEWMWYGAALGACLIFGAGLLDDLFGFRPVIKFGFQLAAAVIAVGSGVTVDAMTSPFGGNVELGILGPFAAMAWILLITNALNLIDGLDGLAGGVALIITTTFASVALALDRFSVVVLALALAGALLGFLRYNFSPARIFMGDGGSQFIGFTLALISIRGSQKSAAAVSIMVPLLALGLPLLDVATTIARRAWSHRSEGPVSIGGLVRRIAQADRKHLHHNLLDLGLRPRRAVLTLYLISALFALSGYLSLLRNGLVLAGLIFLLSIGSVAFIKLLLTEGRQRTLEAARAKPASTPETLSH
jgi:UDP-GlcNAc:undecaprenyl-phosphate GlcNAc-1-phosphate transferase